MRYSDQLPVRDRNKPLSLSRVNDEAGTLYNLHRYLYYSQKIITQFF